jgi:hypothetical protein
MFGRSHLLAGAALLVAAGAAQAQDPPAPGSFEVPRAAGYAEVTEWPDWSGVWYPDWTLLFSGRERANPKLTPAAQAAYDAYLESIRENGPNQEAQAMCLPPGIPGVMQQPYPIEIVYSPGRVTILTEAYEQVRRVYMDGRPLPEDPDLFFNGNSVGHWDGDTLVIDTVGLSPHTNIVPGLPHTEKSRIRERLFLQAPGQLIDEVTITNPDVLTEPFVVRIAYRLDNSFPIREYVCAENNRLRPGDHGANIDLGLDEGEDPFAGID